MTQHILWNRRKVLQRLGYLSGLGFVSPRPAWSFSGNQNMVKDVLSAGGEPEPLFAYVASWEYGIQVFVVQDKGWRLTHTIASDKPSDLKLHPSQRFIYAVNEINEYGGLPTGTVEAYRINARNGQLTLLNRQPLSLSAVSPKYLSVSPDGSSLIISVHGGGSYNVLPIRTDGSLERVSGILKEVGSGPDGDRQDAAHPQMLLFDPTRRRLLSADLGMDKLNVFTLTEGRLIVTHRGTTVPGSGPRSLSLHPSGRMLYVMNELKAYISCFGYDAKNGKILDQLDHQTLHTAAPVNGTGVTAMAIHSSGKFLYTSCSHSDASHFVNSSIAVWRINLATGKLDLIQESSDRLMIPSYLEGLIPAYDALFVLSQAEGVFRMNLDPVSGLLDDAVQIVKVSVPKCMVLLYP